MPLGGVKSNKKRSIESRLKPQRPTKKQRRQAIKAYNSDSESELEEEEAEDEEAQTFDAINLLDSDDDIHNAEVDYALPSDAEASSSEDEALAPKGSLKLKKKQLKKQQQEEDEEEEQSSEDDDEGEEEEKDEFSDLDGDSDAEDGEAGKKSKSKRNDPGAFANSLSKILSTKLTTTKRQDPVLARSADALKSSKAAQDSALEAKARKQMREQKKRALEKGRVKDVFIATRNETTGELESSTAEIMETERRLRKVAQRGVVKLFNAVRASQVAAVEAEKGARKDGVIGIGQRKEKVNELSKKGFLDLIASGGGGLKKGGLEEA